MYFFLILLIFPLVFIPDAGISVPTTYGKWGASDFVMPILYLGLLPYLFLRSNQSAFPRNLIICYALFIGTAIFTTILIPIRYPQMTYSGFMVVFGLLKITKFFEYSSVAYLLTRALSSPQRLRYFELSLAVGCLLLCFSIFYNFGIGYEDVEYFNENIIGITLAALVVFFIGAALRRQSLPSLYFNLILTSLLTIALLIEQGRAGWVAALLGASYLTVLRRPDFRTFIMIGLAVGTLLFSYREIEPLQRGLAKTFPHQFQESAESDRASEIGQKYGIDDGDRIGHLRMYLPKIANEPFIGAGFFNRTPESQLVFTGSHNFFLQIALETGLVGLFFFLMVLYYLWKETGKYLGDPIYSQAYRAFLITIFFGCLTAEYLYGGYALLVFSIISAYYFAYLKNAPLAATQETEATIYHASPAPHRA